MSRLLAVTAVTAASTFSGPCGRGFPATALHNVVNELLMAVAALAVMSVAWG